MGSRFCSEAKSQYSAIEGEALGVAWALDKARHYVMGCPELCVDVDHKPLLGIYSTKNGLADIDNPRLRNLAEKVTRYRFHTFNVKELKTPNQMPSLDTQQVPQSQAPWDCGVEMGGAPFKASWNWRTVEKTVMGCGLEPHTQKPS